MSKRDYMSATDWIHVKFNAYEYSKMKERQREHKLFKREFINAFLVEQERRKIEKDNEECQKEN